MMPVLIRSVEFKSVTKCAHFMNSFSNAKIYFEYQLCALVAWIISRNEGEEKGGEA